MEQTLIDIYTRLEEHIGVVTLLLILGQLLLLGLSIVLIYRIKGLNRVLRRLGGNGADSSIAETIMEQAAAYEKSEATINNLQQKLDELVADYNMSLHYYGLVRYSAFDNTGGNQSFSLALINDASTGLILSTLHGREESRTYAKPINEGKSTVSLSTEEEEALSIAISRI